MEQKRVTWREVSAEQKKWNEEHCKVQPDLVVYDNGLVVPRRFTGDVEDKCYNFQVREDDVWIVSFPKTGTTLTLELVWMLLNDVDVEKWWNTPQMVRTPYFESGCIFNDVFKALAKSEKVLEHMQDPTAYADNMQERRVFKTHLPLDMLPPDALKKSKVVYVGRNIKDTAVSLFHYLSFLGDYVGEFDEFLTNFEKGMNLQGSYWDSVLPAWKLRDHPNLKFIWYEHLLSDKRRIVDELCHFLKHPLSDEKKQLLCESLEFENMKKNLNANPLAGIDWPAAKPSLAFMRKGVVGDWKSIFGEEKSEKWDKWIEEKIEATGLENTRIF